ncbi:T9SS type A sorting domain-containing protein [uncultured Cytophaga sp.]|uniref:T9SS type A sorting domain-containing protein n=1 Tax=uncultured Cytophaga sp. TaxID=160238 RepID=UPI00261B017E|nr:T9SS type A sorting domain-containing protein [uncultured Cytophaga sp.]
MKKLLLLFLSIGMLPILSNAACTLTTTGNQTICAGSTANLISTGTGGFTAYNWTSTGTGTFSNFTTLNSIYTPSNADITAGTVTITITGTGGTCSTTTSSLILTIAPLPTSNAGTDLTRCAGMGAVNLNGTMSAGANFLWTTSGSGSFSNMTMPTSTYIPSTADETTGTVTLTAKVTNASGCVVSDNLVLTFVPMPIVNAGLPQTICPNAIVTLSNATVTNASTFSWTTSGNGTFTNSTTLQTSYFPSALDIAMGSVTLKLSAISMSGCVSMNTMTVTIVPEGTVNAGLDQTITTGSVNLSGTITMFTSGSWSSNGTGTFGSTTSLSTTYTPSASDISNGIVKITLTGLNGLCTTVTDQVLITIGNDLKISGTINVAANKLDKGVVMLFKQLSSGLHFIKSDTIIGSDNGAYLFDHVPAGTYVLVASPITGSSSLNTFLPTYSGGVQTWKTASPITVIANNISNLSLNSYTSADPTWNTGSDVIAGIITVSENASANARTTGATVPAAFVITYLTDASGNKIAYTQTDVNGAYSFKNVKAGNYKIAPEFVGTGLAANGTSIPVTADGNPSTKEDGSMTLEEKSSSTTGVLNKTSSTSVYAYPNPTKDIVTITVSNTSGSGELKLYNETGSVAFQKVVSVNEPTLTVNIEALPKGIYMLQLVTNDTVYTSKVVKQ